MSAFLIFKMAKKLLTRFGLVATRFFRLFFGNFFHEKKNHYLASAYLPNMSFIETHP
jgi:hypothetical protein